MGVVAFNYLKLDAEKKQGKAPAGGLEVKHNLKVDEVQKTALKVGGANTDVLRIVFSFDIIYGNNLGKIGMVGDLIYTDTKEIVDETLKTWDKDKELTLTVKKEVHRFVYNKSIVKSIELADTLGLPSPIPMPKFKYDEPEAKKK